MGEILTVRPAITVKTLVSDRRHGKANQNGHDFLENGHFQDLIAL